jgi:hypothetical protein
MAHSGDARPAAAAAAFWGKPAAQRHQHRLAHLASAEARLLTFNAQVIDFAGGPEGIRTSDLCLRRAPLYRMVHLTGEAPAFKGVGDKATVIDVPDMPSMPPSTPCSWAQTVVGGAGP